MYALIDQNGAVLELAPVEFPVVGDGEWIKFTGDRPSAGAIYDPATKTFGVDIAAVKAAKIAQLTSACGAAILGGYKSSALGAVHTYPSNATDQINMMGSVTASLLPDLADDWVTPFWCADETGLWQFRMHSTAQIQQAGSDGKGHVVSCQTQLATLSAQVVWAIEVLAVEAVVWADA